MNKSVELLTAAEARSRRLVPMQEPEGELGKVLARIEQECYLKSGIYWGYALEQSTIDKLKELDYTVTDASTSEFPAYLINWR